MSDHFTSIVPVKRTILEPEKLGARLVDWLSKQRVIDSVATDCTLGEMGYPPGENYESILQEKDSQLMNLATNGLEVITERHVFHNGGTDLDQILCKICGADLIEEDWQTAIGGWYESSEDENLPCPKCQNTCSITEYAFVPPWGFSNFGLTFWNWNAFDAGFVRDVENFIGAEVVVVFGRI